MIMKLAYFLAGVAVCMVLHSKSAHADVIQFDTKEFANAMRLVENDRTALSLYRKQNADLKQLRVLDKQQLEQCRAINVTQEEMRNKEVVYNKKLEAKIEGLKETIHTNYWFMGSEAIVIAGLIVWIVW